MILPSYGYSHRNVLPKVDLPLATGPVTPMICPGSAVKEISLYTFFPSGYVKLKFCTSSLPDV